MAERCEVCRFEWEAIGRGDISPRLVAATEDNPTPKSMYGAVGLASGIYADEEPATLALEVTVAGALLARTVAALDDAQLARPIFYPWPTPATRTLLWVAAQALHEAEHHLDDVQRLRTPGPS